MTNQTIPADSVSSLCSRHVGAELDWPGLDPRSGVVARLFISPAKCFETRLGRAGAVGFELVHPFNMCVYRVERVGVGVAAGQADPAGEGHLWELECRPGSQRRKQAPPPPSWHAKPNPSASGTAESPAPIQGCGTTLKHVILISSRPMRNFLLPWRAKTFTPAPACEHPPSASELGRGRERRALLLSGGISGVYYGARCLLPHTPIAATVGLTIAVLRAT